MPIRRSVITILAALAGLSAACVEPAAAQGFFDFLFGPRQPRLPPRVSSYADPMDLPRGGSPRALASPHAAVPGAGGRQAAFCVRLCDGRYFPIPQRAGATPAQLCHAACPASGTKVFSGRAIDHAVAADGSRYAGLKNAYVYRDRLVDNCTCNGKDAFGLAPLDVATDPTLRPGDMVATGDGVVAVTGRRDHAVQFTPIDQVTITKTVRDMPSAIKRAPDAAPEPPGLDATTGIAEPGFSTTRPDRHVQFVR